MHSFLSEGTSCALVVLIVDVVVDAIVSDMAFAVMDVGVIEVVDLHCARRPCLDSPSSAAKRAPPQHTTVKQKGGKILPTKT